MNMKNYKKLTKSIFIAITFSFLFSNSLFAQKIDIGEYEMEIIEAFNRNSVGGSVFTVGKKKFVGIRVMLTPKVKKNKGVDLDDMSLKSGDKEYYLIYRRGLNVHTNKGQVIHQRKPKKVMIFAEVDKDMTNATLFYKGKAILDIEVNNDSKIGKYKIL